MLFTTHEEKRQKEWCSAVQMPKLREKVRQRNKAHRWWNLVIIPGGEADDCGTGRVVSHKRVVHQTQVESDKAGMGTTSIVWLRFCSHWRHLLGTQLGRYACCWFGKRFPALYVLDKAWDHCWLQDSCQQHWEKGLHYTRNHYRRHAVTVQGVLQLQCADVPIPPDADCQKIPDQKAQANRGKGTKDIVKWVDRLSGGRVQVPLCQLGKEMERDHRQADEWQERQVFLYAQEASDTRQQHTFLHAISVYFPA